LRALAREQSPIDLLISSSIRIPSGRTIYEPSGGTSEVAGFHPIHRVAFEQARLDCLNSFHQLPHWRFVLSVLSIVVVDLTLSGDNAVVIAAALVAATFFATR